MYLVLVPDDKRKTKVLPAFLVSPSLEKAKKVGEYLEVNKNNHRFLIKEHHV